MEANGRDVDAILARGVEQRHAFFDCNFSSIH
jgi:hypothetical protein